MKWLYVLLFIFALFLLIRVLRLPKSFYENETQRRLFSRRKRKAEKEDLLK